MPSRKSDIAHGSVYAAEGYLRVKLRDPNRRTKSGKPHYEVTTLGLRDTPKNRQIAEQVLKAQYLKLHLGIGANEAAHLPNIREAWDHFLSDKKRSIATETSYGYAFEHIVTDPEATVSKALLRKLAVDFRKANDANEEPYSAGSVNIWLRSFGAFVKWCEYTYELPAVRVRDQMMEEDDPVPRPFTDAQCKKMLADTQHPRVTLYTALMIATGARPVDVLGLDLKSDVDIDEQVIRWKNKRTKRAEVRPLSAWATAILRELIKHPPMTYGQRRNVARRFENLLERCGIATDRSMKHLRQTFLRRIEDAMPEAMQSWLMRHKIANVTERHYREKDFGKIRGHLDAIPPIPCALLKGKRGTPLVRRAKRGKE